jgi:hypothetical protein
LLSMKGRIVMPWSACPAHCAAKRGGAIALYCLIPFPR